MFGPNKTLAATISVGSSHRSAEFESLYKDVISALTDVFELSDYDLLLIPGSATTGMEAIVWSVTSRPNVIGDDRGRWVQRWRDLVDTHNATKPEPNPEDVSISLSCLLETSLSALDDVHCGIVDAVSGFPYFEIPQNTQVFVTCPNKQLSALAGFSIVGVRKDSWENFDQGSKYTTLNLVRYKEYALLNQTPTTPPTASISSLLHSLRNFDRRANREQIRSRAEELVSLVGVDSIFGLVESPVVTVKRDLFSDEIIQKYGLYRGAAFPGFVSIFLYSEDEADYRKFFKDLRWSLNGK